MTDDVIMEDLLKLFCNCGFQPGDSPDNECDRGTLEIPKSAISAYRKACGYLFKLHVLSVTKIGAFRQI